MNRCETCSYFYVPVNETQWKYIGMRVGECGGIGSQLRPNNGGMTVTIESPKKEGEPWLKVGGGLLVDKDFGCVLHKPKLIVNTYWNV